MAARGITIDGEKLLAARIAARMSAAALGRATDVGGEHIRYVEQGERKVSLDLLGRLEQALGVTAEELGAQFPEPVTGAAGS